MAKPKRKELLRQIALLRRALLCDESNREMFRAEALGASGGQHITLADYTMHSVLPPGIWELLNSRNEILDPINKDDPDVKV